MLDVDVDVAPSLASSHNAIGLVLTRGSEGSYRGLSEKCFGRSFDGWMYGTVDAVCTQVRRSKERACQCIKQFLPLTATVASIDIIPDCNSLIQIHDLVVLIAMHCRPYSC